MIRVMIADDHPVVRAGIAAVLRDTHDIEVVAEASDHPSVLRVVQEATPDVLVLDVDMPGGSAIGTVEQIRSWLPSLRILVLSVHPEDALAVRLLRAGASGYLSKDRAAEELVSAVRRVHLGRRHVSPQLAEHLLDIIQQGDGPPHTRLSDREFEVLVRLADGQRITDIASALHLSAKTISTYRTRVLDKLDLQNNAELVRYALEFGLV